MTDEHDVELGELSYLIDQIARHHAHRDAGAVHVTVFETDEFKGLGTKVVEDAE